ncbi:Uncharacterised protein [Vibrio cholerae]|nr:Uncharacterised protein [Vibrio cholerae]
MAPLYEERHCGCNVTSLLYLSRLAPKSSRWHRSSPLYRLRQAA